MNKRKKEKKKEKERRLYGPFFIVWVAGNRTEADRD